MSFTSDIDIAKHVTCSLCLEPWTKPLEVQPCGHIFCTKCILQLEAPKCPECRSAVEAIAEPHRVLVNLTCDLPVKCDHCEWTGTHGSSAEHKCVEDHDEPNPEPAVTTASEVFETLRRGGIRRSLEFSRMLTGTRPFDPTSDADSDNEAPSQDSDDGLMMELVLLRSLEGVAARRVDHQFGGDHVPQPHYGPPRYGGRHSGFPPQMHGPPPHRASNHHPRGYFGPPHGWLPTTQAFHPTVTVGMPPRRHASGYPPHQRPPGYSFGPPLYQSQHQGFPHREPGGYPNQQHGHLQSPGSIQQRTMPHQQQNLRVPNGEHPIMGHATIPGTHEATEVNVVPRVRRHNPW